MIDVYSLLLIAYLMASLIYIIYILLGHPSLRRDLSDIYDIMGSRILDRVIRLYDLVEERIFLTDKFVNWFIWVLILLIIISTVIICF